VGEAQTTVSPLGLRFRLGVGPERGEGGSWPKWRESHNRIRIWNVNWSLTGRPRTRKRQGGKWDIGKGMGIGRVSRVLDQCNLLSGEMGGEVGMNKNTLKERRIDLRLARRERQKRKLR